MTQSQIETYEYCNKYLQQLKGKRKTANNLIPWQNYGCSSGSPKIEFQLQDIHRKLHDDIQTLFIDTIIQVNEIIEKL